MPTNRYDLEILIRTKRTGDDPSPPKDSAFKWTELKSQVDLASKVFNKVAAAAEFAYDNIKQGAELEAAEERFGNLAGTINTTATALLVNLREATKGMQSDAELIAGASDIINLGLADTEEGTVRLATTIGALGLDMQQVVLTFANNSKARLDSLGLSVEDVNTRVKQLNDEGFDGDAFDEAVLQALEEKMTVLGDASLTTAGQLQQLESDWTNLTNSLKQGIAVGLAPVISSLSDQVTAQQALQTALDNGTITTGQFIRAQFELSTPAKENAEILEELGINMEGLTDEQLIAIERAEKQAIAMGINERALEAARQEAIEYSASLAASRPVSDEFNDKILQTSFLLDEEEQAFAEARAELNRLTGSHGEATQAAGEQEVVLGNLLTTVQQFEDRDVTIRFFVEGLGTLERAQELIRNASGFNANDQPDPFNTQGHEVQESVTGAGIDAAAGGTVGAPRTFAPTASPGFGAQYVLNVYESTNASMTAIAVAQQLGSLR